MISKGIIKRLVELYDNTDMCNDWIWDKVEIDEDGDFYVEQGSHLGNTLIMLGDTYEGSGTDCQLISDTLKALPAMLHTLTSHIAEMDDAQSIIAQLEDELNDGFSMSTKKRCVEHDIFVEGECPACILEEDNARLIKENDALVDEIHTLKTKG